MCISTIVSQNVLHIPVVLHDKAGLLSLTQISRDQWGQRWRIDFKRSLFTKTQEVMEKICRNSHATTKTRKLVSFHLRKHGETNDMHAW